ncbi:hypothetical protein P171DRAFT_429736 [Karstenula rhodostoma CBS 690.94]|uniref:Uncharacterized protein n=1 Tax=Karstenula rhodostoma CBS 690.94 TaxID=1392251 RepID=A0A9P4PQ11_9PLEO|nr:hypothetical protein P171DRAFT_429736 [Karstenula rhodostoma CBS 690.94]
MGWKRITETARQLRLQKKLRPPQFRRVKTAVALQGKTGLAERPRKQQLFLDRVLETSHVYFLLCAIAFSQNQVTSTKGTILDSLVEKIASNKANDSILCPEFQSYAVQLGVHGAVRPSKQYSPQVNLQECSQGAITRSETGELHDETEKRAPNTNSRSKLSVQVRRVQD